MTYELHDKEILIRELKDRDARILVLEDLLRGIRDDVSLLINDLLQGQTKQ